MSGVAAAARNQKIRSQRRAAGHRESSCDTDSVHGRPLCKTTSGESEMGSAVSSGYPVVVGSSCSGEKDAEVVITREPETFGSVSIANV